MAAPPPALRAPPGFVEPTFGRRLGGALVDLAVLFVPVVLLRATVAGGLGATAALVVVAAYHVVLTARDGRTLGKAAVGTRVVDLESGAVPSPGQALRRWLTVIAGSLVAAIAPALDLVGAIYGVVVLVPILSGPLHRGLHDRVASTVVTAAS